RGPDDAAGLLELHRPHVVALAAGPDQVDVGGVLGTRHLDPPAGEIGVEITAHRQPPADGVLAGLVHGVVEHVAGLRAEFGQVLAQVTVAAALADDRDVVVAHAHRFAGVDRDRHGDRGAVAVAAALDLDPWRVIAER